MKNLKKALVYSLLILAFGFVYQPAFAASKINLNTATVEQLVELKGIGEKTALKIVKYRKNKKFSTVDELVNVKGIGDKTLDKIRGQLTVAVKKTKK
ncbi:MAG: helix-hairpin-helix domain-containing protein [Desulfuromusa sp.]|nr:helix-hairpin-helix domain-containing protein [Desulfuromusa sp.]